MVEGLVTTVGSVASGLSVQVVGIGGNTLNHVLLAEEGRKGLLVVGNGRALVVGGASAVVREGVLSKVLAYALQCRN